MGIGGRAAVAFVALIGSVAGGVWLQNYRDVSMPLVARVDVYATLGRTTIDTKLAPRGGNEGEISRTVRFERDPPSTGWTPTV
jgi:hypothetical protein